MKVKAPGAVLDGQPFASSWAAFLHAVEDPWDASARTFIKNAMDERIPSEGGFLVPETLRQQVLDYMTDAIVRPRATVLPMSTERLPIPLLDNPSQASAGQVLGGMTFSLVQEGQSFPATVPSFGRVVLEAWKVGGYLASVPNELIDDGAGAFGDFLARIIGKGLAWFEDDMFISGMATGTGGTGVGEPQSLVNSPGAAVVTRTNSTHQAILADIIAMYKALAPASKQGATLPGRSDACWLLSASAMDALLNLFLVPSTLTGATTPTTGAPAPPSEWFSAGNDGSGASLLGMPAFVTDHQPASGTAGDIILADLSLYLIGDRQVMTVDRSQKGAGFVSDTSNYRIKSRVDGRYWIQTSSTTEAGQTVSPLVVLH